MSSLEEIVCRVTGAAACELGDVIQSLWSGYGVIQRATLRHADSSSVIVKHIDISQARTNRRGWSGDVAHQRKVRSYEIEQCFYQNYAGQCSQRCRVPKMAGVFKKPKASGWVIVLEDLDVAGFDQRKQHVTTQEMEACLAWLANFHATFLGCKPTGLWPIGTYWHLDTRPDELAAMEPGSLKNSASEIDSQLNASQFQTFVHGDAKFANFCFSNDGSVAAVDFQYVGGGCGMKDVAYLMSCLGESKAESKLEAFLDYYFGQLHTALAAQKPGIDFDKLEMEWRELYAFAWADFRRFLTGWSPGHWKINEYNDRLTQSVLAKIEDG